MAHQHHNLSVTVCIHWKPVAEGGKKTLPQNGIYYVITEPLPHTSALPCSWSLVIQIFQSDDNTQHTRLSLAEAHFLMDHAPHTLLTTGFLVNIYEGPHLVGYVEVL